jgi:hypothetical protein
MHTKALAQVPTDSYPGVLVVHFFDNLVLLHSCFANDEAAEHLIGLQNLCPCKLVGGFQLFLDCRGQLLLLFLLNLCLTILGSLLGASRRGSNCFLTSEMALNAFPTSWTVPFCSRSHLTVMTQTRYSSLFP